MCEHSLGDLSHDEMLVISNCSPDPTAVAVSLLIHSSNNWGDRDRVRVCNRNWDSVRLYRICVHVGDAKHYVPEAGRQKQQ